MNNSRWYADLAPPLGDRKCAVLMGFDGQSTYVMDVAYDTEAERVVTEQSAQDIEMLSKWLIACSKLPRNCDFVSRFRLDRLF